MIRPLCSLFVAATLSSQGQTEPAPLHFSAMGCGPYNAEAEAALTRFIRLENEKPRSAFLIHCGDIVTGKNKDWPESQYAKVAGLLRTGNKIPTFIVPGDNEWNDQTDPERHWGYWSKHFMGFDKNWSMPEGVLVKRQMERSENAAFLIKGVLMVGINHVGGLIHDKEEWKERHLDNANWIARQFAEHHEDSRAAVIFAQASAEREAPEFLKSFIEAASTYKKPILYLHADGHKWFVKKGHWAPNITHVQLDVVNALFPPVQVKVTMDGKSPFKFDRRLKDPIWRKQPEPKPEAVEESGNKKKPDAEKKSTK